MKHLLLAFLLLTSFGISHAQAPDLINYQAVARNSTGGSIQTQMIGIKVSVLQGSATGTAVYEETHSPTTDNFGAFNLQIGGGSVVSGSFSGINWGSFSHYLKIEMDATGGTNYIAMGTTQMVSVPYAKYAEKAGSIEGNTGSIAFAEMNARLYKITSDTLYTPCDSSGSHLNLEHVIFVDSTNSKIVLRYTYGNYYLFFDPNTLQITSGYYEGWNINSGFISIDYKNIEISFPDGGCTRTITWSRL